MPTINNIIPVHIKKKKIIDRTDVLVKERSRITLMFLYSLLLNIFRLHRKPCYIHVKKYVSH